MTDVSPSEMRTRLASEFEARGWEYDLLTGKAIVDRAEKDGEIDSVALARAVPNSFLQRSNATREDVATAIEHAIGGRVLRLVDHPPTTLIINDNRYQLNMGAGAQIVGSPVNVGGMQINVRADSPSDDILAGVAALVRAGLQGDWNPEAARQLGEVIDAREDVALSDVEAAVAEVVAEEPPEPGRARRMIESISTQGLGGALAVGIVKGLAALVGLA